MIYTQNELNNEKETMEQINKCCVLWSNSGIYPYGNQETNQVIGVMNLNDQWYESVVIDEAMVSSET